MWQVWIKMCSFARNMQSSQKINPTLWRFEGNPLRIDWNTDENVQFCLKHRVVTAIKRLTLCGENW